MSGNDDAQSHHAQQAKQKIDRRVVRTRDRLGDALIALMQEKPFDAITVQEVLDRAGVSRSTFYAHYRDKDDLFLSDADEFLDLIAMRLSRGEEKSERVAPVREFFAHVAEAQWLYAALVEAGRISDFTELAQGHFARGIERRLMELPRAQGIASASRAPLAHALAGAMLSMLQWWLDHRMPTPPEQMDDIFHQMVWSGVSAEATGKQQG
ncbi:MAG: TetR/AcrR family transcriptional regulator [Blastocatellia bacterium]